jgi:hypothetical protein
MVALRQLQQLHHLMLMVDLDHSLGQQPVEGRV